jgi:archaellum component FlaC
MATIDSRVLALETRVKELQTTIAKLTEAINKCITQDQVQQLEILNGTNLDFLQNEVERLASDVDLMRSQVFN